MNTLGTPILDIMAVACILCSVSVLFLVLSEPRRGSTLRRPRKLPKVPPERLEQVLRGHAVESSRTE